MTKGLVLAPPLARDSDVSVTNDNYIFIAVNILYKLQLILCCS